MSPGDKEAAAGVSAGPGGLTLIQRIVTAPQLAAPDAARGKLADWIASLPEVEAKRLRALLAEFPTAGVLLASLSESSPYLWELASREPERLLRLMECEPDRHLSDLLRDRKSVV